MKKWIIISTVLLLGGGGYAGYRYFKRQAELLEDYDIRPVAIRVIKWDGVADMAVLQFTLRITNKSAIEATVTKMYADINLNNQYVGYITNEGNILVPGKGTADAKVEITFAPKQVFKNLVSTISVLMKSSDVPYSMKGYVKLKSSFIGASVPFNYTGSVKKDLLV